MDELMQGMLDQFRQGLQSSLLEVTQTMSEEKFCYPLELNKKQVSQMLGVSPQTFDERFNYRDDFPKIKSQSREKYPRDAVIAWYQENWRDL